MPINPDAVGETGGPVKRSWNSKDALLYAVGIGAGTSDLEFTTENTNNTTQRVLPTFAVIIGGGGAPMNKIGSFNPMLMVHGEQGIELLDEIPPDGEIESTGRIAAIWDKGNAAVIETESEAVSVESLCLKPVPCCFAAVKAAGEATEDPPRKSRFQMPIQLTK